MTTKSPLQFTDLLKKIEAMKQKGEVDLSMEEDLSLAIMNLVSLEEHFFFTGVKTRESHYFDWLVDVRELRKSLLSRMVPRHEGETWCSTKHLLAATMRLIEVGTKLQADGKKDEAQKMFAYAHRLYSIFWALRLKLVSLPELKQVAKVEDRPWTLDDIMNKLVDCCDE